MNLEQAVVYDIETFPNVFTLDMEMLHSTQRSTWEVSAFRDDRQQLFEWFDYLHAHQVPMIGFNSLGFDYPVLHFMMTRRDATVADIYAKAMAIIDAGRQGDRFSHMIWDRDRFAPQVDLFKVHHFDNPAKSTSLKALQVNMRAKTVVDMPVEVGTVLTQQQTNGLLIPYNKHDVTETKQFAHYSMDALNFRLGLVGRFGNEVMNYNDTKIGAKILEDRLGEHLCYDRSSGRKKPRQTPRYKIALADIIFPYIRFNNPEFNRVLEYMRQQVLTPEDLVNDDGSVKTGDTIKTKGAFSGLHAEVGGIVFKFGTGGIHGSVEKQRFVADDTWLLRDIDVEGLYPSIAIVNRLAPAHLGEAFVHEYAQLPVERKKHAKGTVENASFKLAANGTYGNSNNKFSVFYDPQFTMTITINGQLMLCMLAEWLLTVPTLQLIQINTDGITYRIHADHEPQAVEICRQWQEYTKLKLEDANYRRMWIRDVNSYVAEGLDGKLKQKGAYWHPASGDGYAKSISTASPPAWHKDLSNVISTRAAVLSMVHGIPVETIIRAHSDPYDFMLRAKVNKSDQLMLGERQLQATSRYYVAKDGAPLRKIAPAKGPEGEYKRANKIDDAFFAHVMAQIGPGVWDERIHTKNKSKYEQVVTSFEAGWNVAECNDADSFSFANLNHDYYIAEARKLIIA